jgi:thiamine biosynthesis lipoprotein ApbE
MRGAPLLGLMASSVLLAPPLLSTGARAAAAPAPATVTLEDRAFGMTLRLEAKPGRLVDAALRRAVVAVHEVEAASDPDNGPLAILNAAAGSGPQRVPPALLATLVRALNFCRWSEGTQGPLGGPLYQLWGLRVARAAVPAPEALEQAASAAACDRLVVDETKGTVALAAGARLDLWGFAPGAALDRAADALAERGIRDASLTLGRLQRAVGPGPGGAGWPLRVVVPPVLAGFTAGLELRGQAFALASTADGSLRAGGESRAPYLDQRQGRPASGVLATVAITELAMDAQALAVTLFATGNRRGSLLLGQLRPSPAALWVLGDGTGEPLVSDYHWGARQRRGGG